MHGALCLLSERNCRQIFSCGALVIAYMMLNCKCIIICKTFHKEGCGSARLATYVSGDTASKRLAQKEGVASSDFLAIYALDG